MQRNSIRKILRNNTIASITQLIINKLRILKYVLLSEIKSCKNVKLNAPLLCMGKGEIKLGQNIIFGVKNSPFFLNGYSYIEARNLNSSIIIGSNTRINNQCILISEGEGIEIGDRCLIGFNCYISDSDGHNLEIEKRFNGDPITKKVIIGNNVFIGSNVIIGKGVRIGDNTIIAKGSVVSKSFGSNVIIGGVPAKIIKEILV